MTKQSMSRLMLALTLTLALVSCSFMLPPEAKPRTPIQHFIAATHDYTQLAEGVAGFIEVVGARAAAGDASSFRLLPISEELAGLSAEGAAIIKEVELLVRGCTGRSVQELEPSSGLELELVVEPRMDLDDCQELTPRVIVSTGDLRGLLFRLQPRLSAAQAAGGL